MIFSLLGAGALTWVILHYLGDIAQKQELRLSGFLLWCLTNRTWLVLLALPGLVCGIVAVPGGRGRWPWLIVAYVWLLGILVLNLYCFLMTIGPLYQMQEL